MKKLLWLLFLVSTLCPTGVFALDTYFASPRALGMAGANVASVNDTTAQYYNPAAFGFIGDPAEEKKSTDKYGVDLNIAAGYRLHSEFAEYVDDLNDIDLDALEEGIFNESDLSDLVKLTEALNAVKEDKTGATADATAGLGIREGRFCIGLRVYAAASGRVTQVDTQNLGSTKTLDELNDDIETIELTDYDSVDYEFSYLTEEQISLLQDAGYSTESIQRLDYVATQEDVSTADSDGVVSLLIDVADASPETAGAETGGALSDNTTTIELDGISLVELPISYGYKITPHLAIGGNFKIMRARVYKNQVSVFEDDAGDALSETDKHYEKSMAFGFDLGAMARYEKFSFGLVGRNLNAPKFNGFSKNVTLKNGKKVLLHAKDVRVDPQLTAGVAYMPHKTLTIEANIDLLENKTTFTDYDTQNISFGLEWDAFDVLALRVGAYKNLANSEIDFVYTAGLGVKMWQARLDIAGAIASDSYEYDGSDIPAEAKVAAVLSFNF